MAPSKLTVTLLTTFGIFIRTIFLPLYLPLYLVFLVLKYIIPSKPPPPFTEDAEGNLIPVPELPKPKPTPTWYAKRWESFKKTRIMAPIVKRWNRIVIITALLLEATIACAVIQQSLVWFIPWLMDHYQNTEYKRDHSSIWWNDLLLHVAKLMVTCTPLMTCIGIGTSFMYYSRKALKYNRFQKGMIRKPGGRGYYMPEKEKGAGKRHGSPRAVAPKIAPLERVHIGTVVQPDLDMELRQRTVERIEALPHGNAGEVLFDARHEPEPEVIQPPKPAVKFHHFTQQGIQAIWTTWNDNSKGGYDGRSVRKKNFDDDVETESRQGRQ